MANQKIGRNDPCPCGNGKKYKHCHGSFRAAQPVQTPANPVTYRVHAPNNVPPEVLVKAALHFQDQARLEQERVRLYGKVRPEIAVDFKGYKLVAIGNQLLYRPSQNCRFFTDVLLEYIPHLFGREWFDREVAKPPEKRHQLFQWRVKGMNYMATQPRQADGSFCAPITGPLLAYLTVAYDLYVVAHNASIDERLVERLKEANQFQGARHELFAEATCLRAGFKIEHEDEKDRTARHAEFTATHVATGQKISVEAKSKHRPGVLGQSGPREPEGGANLRFGYLLRDAVAKNPIHPLVVFLDMNMPFSTAERFLTPRPPHPFIIRTLNRIRKEHDGKDPITQLIITNHPSHYTKDQEIPQHAHMMGQTSLVPKKPAHMAALMDIMTATNLYGNIPQEFPKAS